MNEDVVNKPQGMGNNNWSKIFDIVSGGVEGISKGVANKTKNKRELKEAKRTTYAELLKNAMRRNLGAFTSQQDYGDEMSDTKTNAMMNIARGFADSFKGATRRK